MSEKNYTLDKGFLLSYSSQVPILEAFESEGDYEAIGRLVMDSIRRQRDNIAFPQVQNKSMIIAQLSFDSTIQARLYGSRKNVPPTVPPTVQGSNHKLSKVNNNISQIITPPLSPSAEGEKKEPKEANVFEERFERFWKAYPRKQGKAAAKKAFLKIKPSDALTVVMVNAVEAQKKSRDWTKDNGEFIPHPATWLNQGRWEDEVKEYVPEEEKPKHSSFTVDEAFSKACRRAYGEVDGQNASISNDEAAKMLEEAIQRSYQ